MADVVAGFGFTVAAFGAAIYFLVLFRKPTWVRLLNGSALLFTAIGLVQVSLILRIGRLGPLHDNALWAALLLGLALLVQSIAALRNRRAWDGVDRRGTEAAA